MGTVSLTPVSVLVTSINLLGALPRAPWAADVLVESLAAEAPHGSSLQRAIDRLRTESPRNLLLNMTAKRVIAPFGDGNTAVYVIAEEFAGCALAVEDGLTRREIEALRRATQRSKEIFVAWAKASATWGPSTVDEMTVGWARRQAVR